MDFPHLSDTKFPLLDNVNVYKYQNNFDYARWNGKVAFKLLNVLWNSNYADVPYFNSVEERDAWFDEQNGYVGTLESLFNNTPENRVKIPIPYNDAYNYNYLVVDMPIQTSANDKINYEDTNIRVSRWFYFIEDLTQFAPSTTELTITVDYWTTFIHSVDIPYLMLERGHAPMTKTSVEQYLANPILNNEYLLADDFNYGKESIIQTSNYIPIGNGKKYVLFCAPYAESDFDRFGASAYSGNSTPPSYEDTGYRNGHQLIVNDYEWKYGDADYSNADIPVKNMLQTGILNGCECYAIDGNYAQEFFNKCAEECVNFIHGIQAMFILDEALFTKSRSITFKGYTIYIADRKIATQAISFTKAQFGFDSKYAEITKLYTFPYSALEITDDDGNTFEAKIENCGQLNMHREVSLVYPFLDYNVFFTGINGAGYMDYTWKVINDTVYNKQMWASDFSKFMMNWKVPTYSLYVSAENEYAVNHFFDMQTKRAGAIKDYKNPVRFANTTYENMADSMDTMVTNVAALGTTAQTNQTVKNEAAADITGSVANDSNGSIGSPGGGTISGGDGINRRINIENNNFNSEVTSLNISKMQKDYYEDNTLIYNTTLINNEYAAMSGGLAAGLSIAGGVSNAILAGSQGAAEGAATTGANPAATAGSGGLATAASIANTGIQVVSAAATTWISMNNAIDVTNATTHANTEKVDKAIAVTRQTNEKIRDNARDVLYLSNRAQRYATTRANTANTTVTDNTVATNNANAGRTDNTETANADYTRDATVLAEKANLVQKQLEAENYYKNARLHPPVTYGSYSGDISQDAFQRRGVRFNIRTQSKSAIAQAGDAMLRFGYALHRAWDMSNGFHYGKKFTFWKAEDIWINDGTGVANIATSIIGDILLKGVTVWRNPNEIGTVGIYNNL